MGAGKRLAVLSDIGFEGGIVGGTVALGLPEYTRKRSRLDIQVFFIIMDSLHLALFTVND